MTSWAKAGEGWKCSIRLGDSQASGLSGKGCLGCVREREKERGRESWRNTDADKEMKTSGERTGSHGRMLSKGRTRGFAEVAPRGKQGLHGGVCLSPPGAGLPELGPIEHVTDLGGGEPRSCGAEGTVCHRDFCGCFSKGLGSP